MIRKSIGLAGVVLLALLFLMLWRQSIRPPFISPAQYAAILDDLMGVDFVFRSPMPDPGSAQLAYIHAAAHGRGLYLLDLAALTREAIGVTNEVTHLNGWSPDGRYLAFVQTAAETPAPNQL